MLTSLALIFLVGMTLGWLFTRLRLPSLLGMLITGILLGPYVLNLLDDSILGISADLRQLALIIILTRAGLSLNLSDLKRWAVRRFSCVLCRPALRWRAWCFWRLGFSTTRSWMPPYWAP